ncbi:hypothetical protein [Thermococcus sp.]
MKKCFLLVVLILLMSAVVQENFSLGDVVLIALLSYLCGLFDGISKEGVKEPYIIGDSNEIVYLTKKELEERMKKKETSLHDL